MPLWQEDRLSWFIVYSLPLVLYSTILAGDVGYLALIVLVAQISSLKAGRPGFRIGSLTGLGRLLWVVSFALAATWLGFVPV